ncbi:MAG: hydroxypyruvate isomerase [Methylococcaceae bacterium NSP1-2]|nr:TIM barrel protein [Methylococcaceae bacterium]OYV20852.1 MAG: hydroxypyruvate isomerase [Methylococcaceae bacterium NSP1-2]
MKLKFTANLSLLFTELDFIDRFKAAKQHGFKAVEIQFPYELSPETLQQVLQDTGLKLVLFNVAADDLMQGGEGLACVPEKCEQFRHALALAADYATLLKPEVINVLAGRCFDNSRLAQYQQTFKDNLLLAADTFALLGIKTVFEAINTDDMPAFIIHSGEQMLAILDELQHPNLFMQYDIYHASKMDENPQQFIRQHADKIGHIQFADCPNRGQPSTGQIDFQRLFDVIEQSSYTGWLGAEYKPTGTTAESLSWFRSIQ